MKSRKSMFYLLAIVVVASLFFGLVASTYADGEKIILSVPYYKQQSQFYCEYASLEMVFDYYGVDIPQQELVAVENMPGFQYASHGKATEYYWTAVVREAHFSNLSTSYESCEGFTITGYKERDLGYAAFWYGSWDGPWLEELKDLIDEGYPIIVLQWFDFYEEAGHVRVVIGYDDTTGEVIFHD
ncbi:MAG: C39 family peptidase, partial [Candidatus Bathyarchaeota archaeon]